MNYLRSPIETDKYNHSLHRSVGKLDNDNFQHYKLQPLEYAIITLTWIFWGYHYTIIIQIIYNLYNDCL
jgi:hypothetical protein